MLNVKIPGQDDLSIRNIVFDFNGTLATDGKINPRLGALVAQLKLAAELYILTADTYGSVQGECRELGVPVKVLSDKNGTEEKTEFVRQLGAESVVCIGNGMNDSGMFEACALSIAVIGEEGCSVKALMKADIAVKNIEDAFMLLLKPERITATLRV